MSAKDWVRTGARMGKDRGKAIAEQIPSNTRVGRAAQSSTVLAAVVIGVIAIIGVYIFDQVYTTMPNPTNSDLNNSTNSITTGFGDALEFVPVILIVLMAAVVIGVVQTMRG